MSLAHQIEIFARTIWGEARGEPYAGQVAVAWVIKNRTKDRRQRWPRTVAEVCQQPKQFSCWNGGPNTEAMKAVDLDSESFVRAWGIACLVMSGDVPDYSKGSAFYMRSDITDRIHWDDQMEVMASIGAHTFFRG